MVRLEYKSLVTKETIDYYLSKIKDDEGKKDLISTVSKFDIRISTQPIIEEEYEEFYYKIWIWRRGTKKRAHIKLYNRLELLKKEEGESKKTILLLSLGIILCWIRTYANVPDDFEEYCEITFRDPSDDTSRIAYPIHLKRAERFKKFITKEEIKSIPAFLPCYDKDLSLVDDDEFYDLDTGKYPVFLDSNSIFLKKREYDKLADVKGTLEYHGKIVERYGYDPYTGEYDIKKFPITKEDKQKENIDKDFDNFDQALEEYVNCLKELIKKYGIKSTGNLQRLTFKIDTNYNDNRINSKHSQLPNFDSKYISVTVDCDYFVPDA